MLTRDDRGRSVQSQPRKTGTPPSVWGRAMSPSALGPQCSTTLRSVYAPDPIESRAEPPTPASSGPADEPLSVPMGAACAETDGRLLALAGLVSCAALAVAASAALLWL